MFLEADKILQQKALFLEGKEEEMRPNELLFAVIHLSAFVCSHVFVEQQPTTVHVTEGENVTLSCHIHADEEGKISKFRVQWYREGADGQLHEVVTLSQFRGRLRENANSSQQSASLSLFMLELNDTSKYFCNFIYRIDQKILQHYANGTILIVQEPVTTDTTILSTTDNTVNKTDADTENTTTENTLLTFLIALPLSLKFVATVFIGLYTLFSYTSIVISCTGLHINVR
ncbi:uncharacterized protein LOC132864739 [Neoarius graeffei]|uniref:uncharacterized protein LOC132864739 n=1 Tax=Neoarius graeffei TaxID=443677 RepID=UPI00298D403E|nr:uncharacterized protein LOC132864739 [Neoarius graeffei]